jgi:hypothetical protein
MIVKLRRVAHLRSGDKGNTATISVIAYAPEFYPLIERQVDEAAVARVFASATGPTRRYRVPAIGALNFTVEGALGGGVSRNLALDVYGKALCAALLTLPIEIPDDLAPLLVGPAA